jgi:hypothetical protein
MTTTTSPKGTLVQSDAPVPEGRGQRPVGRRALLGGGLATLLGAGGTAGWAANRYLVDHVEVTNASTQQSTAIAAVQAAASGTTTATSYSSDTATIGISKVVTGSGTSTVTYYVADVTISDATILRSAFANDQFGENIVANPSVIAAQVGAKFAINGDYYGFRDTGIVIRNGVAFRDKGARQGLAFYSDGSLKLYDETTTTAQALLDARCLADLVIRARHRRRWQSRLGHRGSVEVDTNVGNHSIQGQPAPHRHRRHR